MSQQDSSRGHLIELRYELRLDQALQQNPQQPGDGLVGLYVVVLPQADQVH